MFIIFDTHFICWSFVVVLIIKKESIVVYKNHKPAFVTVPIDVFEEIIDFEENTIKTAVNRYLEIKTGKSKTVKGKDAWEVL